MMIYLISRGLLSKDFIKVCCKDCIKTITIIIALAVPLNLHANVNENNKPALKAQNQNSGQENNQNQASDFQENKALFETLFNRWTNAFNHQDLNGSCQLFSKSVKAKYRGAPEKNYDSICNNFAKIFKEQNKNYFYSYEIHDVYRQGNLAAVRITWYLQIKENGRNKSIIQDEGLDILERNEQNEWKIINYLAYQEN